MRRPRVILADEPTGALDVETGARVMTLLADISKETGAALVTITHDESVAARADRMLRLDAGVLVPSGAGHHADASLRASSDPQLGLGLDSDPGLHSTAHHPEGATS